MESSRSFAHYTERTRVRVAESFEVAFSGFRLHSREERQVNPQS
jgi:hypothetical protein